MNTKQHGWTLETYVEWKKPNTEGYIKYEINFIELNNKQNHIYSLKKT